jgi:hypothetical protein
LACIDVKRRLHHLVGGGAEFLAFAFVEISGAEPLAVDAGGRAQHAGQQGLLRHFKREDRHWLKHARGDVPGDVERERGFAHRRTSGEDDEFAGVEAAGHFVELGKAGADAFDALAGIEEGVESAFVILDDFEGRFESLLGAGFA